MGILTPALVLWTRYRVRTGKEDPVRYGERFGKGLLKRPNGKLYWFHGASNGECLSFLPLLRAIKKDNPKINVLVTSGTRTSAELLKKRLGKEVIHQFCPLDNPLFVYRFLNHFKPDVCFRTESDYWPITILDMKKRGPLFLLNGRLSQKSLSRWAYMKPLFLKMLRSFSIIFPQSFDDFRRYKGLQLENIQMIGNLKFEGEKLEVDQGAVHKLKKEIGRRPMWMASNTHEGEEVYVLDAHKKLLHSVGESLLLILIPRHKHRLPDIFKMLDDRKLHYACRTAGKKITESTSVYIVDTMGELGNFYSLTNFVFMAGSFFQHIGGHNILEPARLGALPLFGPHMENNQEMATRLLKNKAAIQIKKPSQLSKVIHDLLSDKKRTEKQAQQVRDILKNINILEPTLAAIKKVIHV